MNYRLALFDFDGTLADTLPFFLEVYDQVAVRYGFRRITEEQKKSFRLLHTRQVLKELGIPTWKLPFVARTFLSLLSQNQKPVPLFEGVPAMLQHLRQAGVILTIVTSNAKANVDKILGPDLVSLFDHFECGMSIFGKAPRLARILKKTGCPPDKAVAIGDQLTDLDAARKLGIPFGAVTWGYAAPEAWVSHKPELVFETVADLAKIS